MSLSQYGELCTQVYELTKPVGYSFGGDITFYRERLQRINGRILEVMSGSGRMLIPLLEARLQIDGVDASPDMLAACRRRCEERGLAVQLYESTLEELALPHRYDAMIIPAGSLLLIEDRQASIQALKRLFDHLLPGGRLLLDLFLPEPPFEAGRDVNVSTFSLPDGDTITMERRLVEVDLFNQVQVSYLRYEKWRNGRLLQTELQRFAVRWYGIEEFKLILEHVGFTDVAVFADFDPQKPPSREAQQFVYEAVRR